MSGRGQRPPPLFGGGFFGGDFGFADSIMDRMLDGMFRGDPWGAPGRQQQQQQQPSSAAREIPIEGPEDKGDEPREQHRLTGPLIHELPDNEEPLHQDLVYSSTSHPDTVQEPDDHSAHPYLPEPTRQLPLRAAPQHQQQQQQQHVQATTGVGQLHQSSPRTEPPAFEQQTRAAPAAAADPLAAMGTGPPPTMYGPLAQQQQQVRPLPPLRTARGGLATASGSPSSPILVDLTEAMGHMGTPAGRAGGSHGSPMLVDLTEGLGLGDSLPRHLPGTWPPSSSYTTAAGPPPLQSAQAPQQQQKQRRRQQQQRSQAADGGGLLVSTPTAQAPAAGMPFTSSPPFASSPIAEAAGAPAAPAAPGPILNPPTHPQPPGGFSPMHNRNEPVADSRRGGSASPAAQATAEPRGTAAGRRHRRPSSRSPAVVEAGDVGQAAEGGRGQRARQPRQARSRGRQESGFGALGSDEEDEGVLTGEDPDWQPGRQQQQQARGGTGQGAGSPPTSKRSRRAAAAPP